MKVGEMLSNGAVVIASKPSLVLAILPWNTVTPYASWCVGEDGDLFSGHYFYQGDLSRAVADFADRLV